MEQLKPDLFASGFMFLEAPKCMTASFGCRTFSTIKFLFCLPPATATRVLSRYPIARRDLAIYRTAA